MKLGTFLSVVVCGWLASSWGFLPQKAHADTLHFSSGIVQTPVVELYSSQGCSSCPPAEKWLASLKTHPGLWKDFLPLEFHVEYWNYLGWTDVFSRKAFTDRQRAYTREWGKRTLYTPGFVWNGKVWRPGKDTFPRKSDNRVGVLTAQQKSGGEFAVTFVPTRKANTSYTVYVALLGNGLSSKVNAGENVGVTLEHEFVVLAMNKSRMKKSKKSTVVRPVYTGEVVLPSNQRAKPSSYSVAFWVSSADSLRPLQSVGGPIRPRALHRPTPSKTKAAPAGS